MGLKTKRVMFRMDAAEWSKLEQLRAKKPWGDTDNSAVIRWALETLLLKLHREEEAAAAASLSDSKDSPAKRQTPIGVRQKPGLRRAATGL